MLAEDKTLPHDKENLGDGALSALGSGALLNKHISKQSLNGSRTYHDPAYLAQIKDMMLGSQPDSSQKVISRKGSRQQGSGHATNSRQGSGQDSTSRWSIRDASAVLDDTPVGGGYTTGGADYTSAGGGYTSTGADNTSAGGGYTSVGDGYTSGFADNTSAGDGYTSGFADNTSVGEMVIAVAVQAEQATFPFHPLLHLSHSINSPSTA